MSSPPIIGTETARPFVPARDFALSQRFYEAFGFTKTFANAEIAIFSIGEGKSFLLQNYYQQQWAENFMMQFVVENLDAWWAHLEAQDLPGKFGVPALKPPVMQPWGLVVGYLIDPSGVLWHITNRP